jgi:hypothetical protein
VKPLNDTAENLKAEFCRGQEPAEVPQELYDTLDDWTKKYVRANTKQWLDAGCKV